MDFLFASAQPGQSGGGIAAFLPFIVIMAIIYFLMIRPQTKRQKEKETMRDELKKGDKIITMDDDLQHSPSSIKDLINELNKGFDICYTKYLNRQHPLWKKIMSWINNFMASHLLNKPYNIYLSSYRAFQKKIVKEIINYDEPNVYIDGLVLKITRNISIVSVPHNQRLHGPSNYGFKKLLSLWSNMAINFPIFPLRISSIFGLIILSTIIIIRKISFPLKQETRLQYIIVEKTAND